MVGLTRRPLASGDGQENPRAVGTAPGRPELAVVGPDARPPLDPGHDRKPAERMTIERVSQIAERDERRGVEQDHHGLMVKTPRLYVKVSGAGAARGSPHSPPRPLGSQVLRRERPTRRYRLAPTGTSDGAAASAGGIMSTGPARPFVMRNTATPASRPAMISVRPSPSMSPAATKTPSVTSASVASKATRALTEAPLMRNTRTSAVPPGPWLVMISRWPSPSTSATATRTPPRN